MYALILHKDIQLRLYNIQKNYIYNYNSRCLDRNQYVYPVYPLWAFLDTLPKKITELAITGISRDNSKLYFELSGIADQENIKLQINFAQAISEINRNLPDFDYLDKKNFPLIQRIFRIGKVFYQDNNYKVYDSKWYKLY